MSQGFVAGKLRLLAAAMLAAGLMACSSPEEKVANFYQKGKTYLEQGDTAKARLEFQNALQINPNMVPALYGLAEIAERASDWQRAFGLLSKVVELDAKHLDAQVKVGKLLLAAGQLDKALATSDVAMKLAPDTPDVLVLRAAVLLKLNDTEAALKLANQALVKAPQHVDALVVLASERLMAGDPQAAIGFLDRGLAGNEKNIALQLIKVQALEKLANRAGAEEIYLKLVSYFPESKEFRYILGQFYLVNGEKEKAEAQYRAVVAAKPKDSAAALELVRFLSAVKGSEAAMAELNAMIAADPKNFEHRFLLAGLYQQQGKNEAAEAIYKEVTGLAGDAPDALKAKGLWAGAILARGDKAAANALITEIIAKDARNEQGLLLRASVAMDDGKLEEAVGDLRTILRDVPDSARAHALLAKAHEMQGAKDLAEDHYSRAFKAGKQQTQFGMAYAEFLLRTGKAKQVEDVLKDVLRAAPGDVAALKMLAQAYINAGNLAGAQAVADELAKLKNQQVAANQVQGAVFAARKNYENSIASFRRAYELSPSDVQPMVALVRSYLVAGKSKEALSFMQSVVEASPNNADAKVLLGQLLLQAGKADEAKQAFESAVTTAPKNVGAHQSLVSLYASQGKMENAEQAADAGLKATPDDFGLRLSKAGIYETQGKIDNAIALYEQLLKERPGADVVANNLASLLADFKSDKASLQRAHELAQRLKKSDIPQFKDTVGWASYRVGKYDEADIFLKNAAEKMPDLAVIHFHRGMTMLAMNKKDAARESLKRAVELGKVQPFPQLDEAKATLEKL